MNENGYFGGNEEGIISPNGGLSSPYIINVINNSPNDKLATIFNANAQLQELNNTALDGILAFSDNTLISNLTLAGESNGKPFFTFSDGAFNFSIEWSGAVWNLIRTAPPSFQYELSLDIELPIGTSSQWTQLVPTPTIPNFNTKREIQPTSSIPGVTYPQILQQSTIEPFLVGKTQIYSSNVNQLLEVFTRTEKDVNGNLVSLPFVPTIDPYQNNAISIEFYDEYMIDGNTGLQFISKANSSCRFVIYPKEIVYPQNELSSVNELNQYEIDKSNLKEVVLEETNYSNFVAETKKTKVNIKPFLIGSSLVLLLIYILKKWD